MLRGVAPANLATHLSLWTYLLFPLFFSSQELLSPTPGAFSGSTLLGGFGGTRIRRRKMHFFFFISFPHRNLGSRGEETALSQGQGGGPQEHPASRPVPIPRPTVPGGSPAFIAVECIEEVGAALRDWGARQLRRDGGGEAGLGARCGYAKTKQTGELELRVSAPAQGQGAREAKAQSHPGLASAALGAGEGGVCREPILPDAVTGFQHAWVLALLPALVPTGKLARYDTRTKGNPSAEEGD